MPHSDAGEGSDRSSGLGRGKGQGKGGPKRGRGKGGGRRRREPSPVPPSHEEEEEEEKEEEPAQDQEQEREEEEWQADALEEEEESSKEEDTAEDTSTPAVWLRGPSRLPDRPIPVALRPLIQPCGDMSWTVLSGGAHKCKVNGILGLLCREHFPGLVHYQGQDEPAWTWDHYIAANNDQLDRSSRDFENKAERVKGELWDFYRCDEGYEERVTIVAHNRCVKLVKDMHYEAQVQCVINYCAHFLKQKIGKPEARELKLTREQYLQVPAWWCRNDTVCWECIVDKWFDPEWQALHDAGRQRRLLMPGPTHHQGSLNNDEYRARWSSSHEG